MPSLLLASDFSAEAGYAARRAAAMAKEGQAALHLVHVLPASLPATLHVAAAGRAQDALAALAEQLAGSGVRVTPELLSGEVAGELVAAGARHDLVVLGARGQHASEGPYRRVVAAIDFTEPSFDAAARGAALAPSAHFDLIHAFEVEFESSLRMAGVASEQVEHYRQQARQNAMAGLDGFAGRLGLPRARVSPAATHGYPPRVICEHAARAGAELIVIGKHRAGLVERTLIGSVALQVLESAPCDVLVVPEGAG